ncbi:transposase, ISPsy2-related protein [Azotobacter vinelandii CA]|uniref:Transposase, ISPsy2-related n=2 Tax=Azotobacter vinelandii TaxID=354 RepID=C1DDS9_AZOVD|nr:hypothetical protein [Azotobacter vinelandii]ACO78050.1 transposase, ISPsy2-related [Azotobacter vinelandii DJ]AGK16878.1 transposase, ISPsy2-related protein [Azotobacter vinelandii CA]AGK20206.1 transposase, ISPsy2-related protein [Azotobacter vinelandii CA6]GLK61953.1 hypothetical protein GCM10017624_41170 [Azotobacter vinelandii]
MKQMTFADAEYAGKRKQTRQESLPIEMARPSIHPGSAATGPDAPPRQRHVRARDSL